MDKMSDYNQHRVMTQDCVLRSVILFIDGHRILFPLVSNLGFSQLESRLFLTLIVVDSQKVKNGRF